MLPPRRWAPVIRSPQDMLDTLANGLQDMSQTLTNFANVMQTQQEALQASHNREMMMAYALAISQRDIMWTLQAGAPQTPAEEAVPIPHFAPPVHEEHAEEEHGSTHTTEHESTSPEHFEHADEEDEEDEENELLEADDGGSNTQHDEDAEGPQKKRTRYSCKTTEDPKKKKEKKEDSS